MTARRPLQHLAIAVVALGVIAAACSSDDDSSNSSDTTATTVATSASTKFSTTPSSEWGALAKCKIGPQTAAADAGGTPADEGVDGVIQFGKQTQNHVDGCVDYKVRPSVGGDHHPVWANCGFYTSSVPEEAATHVLEHGGVWIAFDPSLDPAQVTTIKKAAAATTHILAAPYPGLRTPVVMTAWSRQLNLDSVDDPRFQKFIDTYLQGPNTPELGATCSGGLGTPG